MVLEKDAGNGMEEICEQGGSFKENLNEKETYASDQKNTVKISGHLIEEIGLWIYTVPSLSTGTLLHDECT